jgi:hypothetical protein
LPFYGRYAHSLFLDSARVGEDNMKAARIAVTLAWFCLWPILWMHHLLRWEDELVVTLLVVLISVLAPRHVTASFRGLRAAFLRVAARPRLSIALVGASVLLIRAALLPVFPVPVPQSHDEASYLLAADTFASGRLANPGHPMWVHLEAIHVNHWPIYGSKYPPAQGFILALGQVLGHPWIGVWLSMGVMCAAICWMLQGWFPPGWALLGACLAVTRLGVNSYWMNSYWGGAAAAIGGALVFGAYPRLRKDLRVRDAVLLSLGLLLLANSRPYEGLCASVPLFLALSFSFWKKHRSRLGFCFKRLAAPAAVILLVGATAMAYYNQQTTGDPMRFAYQVHAENYSAGGLFPWQPAKPFPEYRHDFVKELHVGYGFAKYQTLTTLQGFFQQRLADHLGLWDFFLGPLFTLPLVALPWMLWDRRIRFLIVTFFVVLVASSLPVSFHPHYWAPMTAVIWALVIQSMRHLRVARSGGRRIGEAMVTMISFAAVFMVVWCQVMRAPTQEAGPDYLHSLRCRLPDPQHSMSQRQRVQERLEKTPGRHLVIVRYPVGHNTNHDWVFNKANIDDSRVVWARDMGPERNRDLLRYFHDREVWLADVAEAKLLPYTPPTPDVSSELQSKPTALVCFGRTFSNSELVNGEI